MGILVAIETDYENLPMLINHLREAQAESDEAKAESPEDYPDGLLRLESVHVSIGATVAGILYPSADAYKIVPLPNERQSQ